MVVVVIVVVVEVVAAPAYVSNTGLDMLHKTKIPTQNYLLSKSIVLTTLLFWLSWPYPIFSPLFSDSYPIGNMGGKRCPCVIVSYKAGSSKERMLWLIGMCLKKNKAIKKLPT